MFYPQRRCPVLLVAVALQAVKSKEQQSMYRMNSSSPQQQRQQHQAQVQQQQQQPQQPRASMMSWQSLNVLSEELGRQELERMPHSLPMHFPSQMGMPADADLDPLDPAFLASINDPCSSGKVRCHVSCMHDIQVAILGLVNTYTSQHSARLARHAEC